MRTYKYDVGLIPAKPGNHLITLEKFKYPPGEIDRFLVGFKSEWGYEYEGRIRINCIDAKTGKKFIQHSEKLRLISRR